ncbi:MAG: PfkB family carbohydrate kinase [Candidatus Nealsonbacteria bacterium]
MDKLANFCYNSKTEFLKNKMTKQFDLIVIGHISYDENNTFFGTKTVPSGAAYLVALPASIYSKKIGVVARVGEDYDLENLKKLKIDLNGIKVIPGGKTTRFYHNYKTKNGSIRNFKAELNVGVDLCPNDIPTDYLNSKFIHIATMPPHQQKKFIDFLKSKTKAKLSIDTLEQYVQQWPKKVLQNFSLVDLIFIDKREKKLIGALKRKNVVIKKGADGAECFYNNRVIKIVAPRVKVVDKTGAGDVLAGVFLILLAKGKKPVFALKEAVNLASKSVTQFGIDFLLE